MDSGGSSGGNNQGKKKGKKRVLTAEELENRQLENVQPTSWDDEWIVTLNITDNVVEDEDTSSIVSSFSTDSPFSIDAEEETDKEEADGDGDKKKEEEDQTDDDDGDQTDDGNGEDLS
ncbi:ribosome biogenesis protein BOP1 homolog isoform X2 [Triticum aestivum]|uniref:ribosome biogenesis protein BOP1 homolog isoform X2 n=1 Tax=Triticum aestivum TaxID=4565 RepID=UPI001D00AB1C|nr:ribosome biogenesis protein BOP1 homolog isoform X2 [Triticum aestivum]